MDLSRRDVLSSGLGLVAAQAVAGPAHAQDARKSAAPTARYGAALTGLGITSALATHLTGIQFDDLPQNAVHEARRAVLDWIGCALAGSTHPTMDALLAALDELGSTPVATVLGRRRKLSLLDAAVANGQMGHILDFDDTHLGGVILHTSTATLPALFALGERRASSGREIVAALAAAFEAGIRVGQAAPGHHLAGWHLTGTLGTVASAAASARLLRLDSTQTTFALGIACTQAAGLQQNRGSDCKSLHAGKSAYHGVLAATLASKGFNSSPEILEGSLGFTKVFSATQQHASVLQGLGRPWLITGNGYKPYACGVVLHPLVDATIEVSRTSNLRAADVARIELLVHPDVIRITGIDAPNSDLMTKFSANHAAAVAFLDRAAGVTQFTRERADDATVLALRKLVRIAPLPSLRLDQAAATITATSGSTFRAAVDHATGTVDNPMSDAALEQKFLGNATPVIGAARARQVRDLAWTVDTLADIGALVRACA